MSLHHGPETEFSENLHAQKYRQPGESFRDCCSRLASSLSDNDSHFRAFRSILLGMGFMPGGRIQSAIGSGRQTTAFNCFVSGAIADSMTGSEVPSWAAPPRRPKPCAGVAASAMTSRRSGRATR